MTRTELLHKAIEWENGELSDAEVIVLFSLLVQTGEAYRLQGFYGRTAQSMIEQRYLSNHGLITEACRRRLPEIEEVEAKWREDAATNQTAGAPSR